MKIFESNIEILKRSSPAKMRKRFVSCVTDMLIVIFLAGCLFLGLFGITKNSAGYKDSMSIVESEIKYYEKLTEETHVVEYVNGQRVSAELVVYKNLCRAICLSYEVFGNEQQPNFVIETDHYVTINGVHSLETDNVAYFYSIYLEQNPILEISKHKDLFEIYKASFGADATFIFTFNKEVSEVPVLNTQVAYYLFYYLFIDETDNIGQTGATYYDAYYKAYSNMLEEAENLIIQSEPYYSTHYLDYRIAYCKQSMYTNVTLVISILFASFIVLFVPKSLFKDEKTIAYKFFGLGVVNLKYGKSKWYMSLTKTIIKCFGFIPIAFILYLIPPFNGVYESMFIPLTVDSKVSLASIILIIIILAGIVNVFGLFTLNRQNLLNLLFNDVVVDVHYIDEGQHREINQGRSY